MSSRNFSLDLTERRSHGSANRDEISPGAFEKEGKRPVREKMRRPWAIKLCQSLSKPLKVKILGLHVQPL